jgi:RimJ/RimL family protein N-acetyltransferase
MHILPVTLEGTRVRLEPLTLDHLDDLAQVALDPELWRWTVADVHSRELLRDYLETAMRWQREGSALPFATVATRVGKAIGSTRYANIDRGNRRLEIGWTWLGRDWQRTACNTEAKYLMLGHAFEVLGCVRVEFKTDVLNAKSRAALERIGATQEGIFRQHMVCETGRLRDSVYYSIIDREWPEVKLRLERRLHDGAVGRPEATAS